MSSYDADPTSFDPFAEITAANPYRPADMTYNDYLKVPELLQLQALKSQPPHHDEMLFIVIHQAYELWFKLILHEVEKALGLMQRRQILPARHFLHRVGEIMKLLVQQIHILETMTPADFLQFRDRLEPASGFQSVQFREVEFAMGLKDERYLRMFNNRPDLRAVLERRLNEPDLRSAYYELLRQEGFDLPDDVTIAGLAENPAAAAQLLAALKIIYQNPIQHLPLYVLSESLVDLDEQLNLWRYHHVRVVERIIGHKMGTGGSTGIGYLQKTTVKRCFPYLWQVRSELTKGALTEVF
ncbi:MAG: tryptophan 2,3-dioxygenase [Anaerolineae bacterium]|nr:tryptophan 2,3-dioxygenase [Anaerolineae bacterium]